MGTFEEEREKQIPSTSISTAIGRCSNIQLKTVQMSYESVVRRLEALLKVSSSQTPFIKKFCQYFPCVGIILSNRHQDSLSILSFLVVCNLSSTVKPIHLFSNIVLVKSCNASSSEYIFLVGLSRAQDVYASEIIQCVKKEQACSAAYGLRFPPTRVQRLFDSSP